jgi:hypothetical protein
MNFEESMENNDVLIDTTLSAKSVKMVQWTSSVPCSTVRGSPFPPKNS